METINPNTAFEWNEIELLARVLPKACAYEDKNIEDILNIVEDLKYRLDELRDSISNQEQQEPDKASESSGVAFNVVGKFDWNTCAWDFKAGANDQTV